jgi:hypothetical protein
LSSHGWNPRILPRWTRLVLDTKELVMETGSRSWDKGREKSLQWSSLTGCLEGHGPANPASACATRRAEVCLGPSSSTLPIIPPPLRRSPCPPPPFSALCAYLHILISVSSLRFTGKIACQMCTREEDDRLDRSLTASSLAVV